MTAPAPQQQRASAPAPQQVSSFSASGSGADIASSLAPAASVPRLGSGGAYGTNFTTPFLEGTLQAFNNATFNFTQCYSNAPTISVTLKSQLVRFFRCLSGPHNHSSATGSQPCTGRLPIEPSFSLKLLRKAA